MSADVSHEREAATKGDAAARVRVRRKGDTSAALAAALLGSEAAPSKFPGLLGLLLPRGLPGELAVIFCGMGAEDAGSEELVPTTRPWPSKASVLFADLEQRLPMAAGQKESGEQNMYKKGDCHWCGQV